MADPSLSGVILSAFLGIDESVLSPLPIVARVVAWGVIAGILTMATYALLAPQGKIKETRQAMKSLDRMAALKSEDIKEVLSASWQQLRLSFRVLRMMFGASMISGFPVLFILFCVDFQYGYQTPMAGDQIAVTALTAEEQPAPVFLGDGAPVEATIAWPGPDSDLILADSDKHQVFAGRLHQAGLGVLHQHRWWNYILGNPAGYLADGGPIDFVAFTHKRQVIISAVPDWLSGWELPFFLVLVVTSLSIKGIFRIQ
jgi:hypothetical protein